jgi:ribonucleoside-diphosphate reductase alpha chain
LTGIKMRGGRVGEAPAGDPDTNPMNLETRFGSRDAAEVWDAEFRWRENGRLRDVTVDDTWHRVAAAIASAGRGPDATARARTYAQSFARWRLLPAPALLAGAGTQTSLLGTGEPYAVLNCAAFIAEGIAEPLVDWRGFAEAARLAQWLLDDAATAVGGDAASPWIGLIGLGAALSRLGIAYDSAEARSVASRFASSASVATSEALIQIAAERGARLPVAPERLDHWRSIGLAAEWLSTAERLGLRQTVSLRVARVPLLARLAHTTDALDPAGDWRASDGAQAQASHAAERAMQLAVQQWFALPVHETQA